MSKIALSPNISGTGTVTIAAPNTDSDFTLTLPASSGTLLDSTGGTTLTNLTVTNGASIQGLTVGRGAGAVSTNTAVGASALAANTTGLHNTANGYESLKANTSGNYNNAIGYTALYSNTTGANNTANGVNALYSSTTGGNNTAIGFQSLLSNTTASNNTAVGYQAGYAVTTGVNNTFIGKEAGKALTTADESTYVGDRAGISSTGGSNTFIGEGAGFFMTTGTKNTILGKYNGNQGGLDIRTSSNYIVLSDGDGNPRAFMDTATFYSIGIYNTTTGGGANVNVASNGALLRSTSSLKYKRDVQNASHGLAEVLQLRPVTYKGKSENDGDTVFGGLIAEEVHEAGLTEFVQYADDGTPDALAYGHMVSLCVKAIQELKAEFDAYKEAHP